MDWQNVGIVVSMLTGGVGVILGLKAHVRSEREMHLKTKAEERADTTAAVQLRDEGRQQARLAIDALESRVATLEGHVEECESHMAECRAEMARADAERKQHKRELSQCNRERLRLAQQLSQARG